MRKLAIGVGLGLVAGGVISAELVQLVIGGGATFAAAKFIK